MCVCVCVCDSERETVTQSLRPNLSPQTNLEWWRGGGEQLDSVLKNAGSWTHKRLCQMPQISTSLSTLLFQLNDEEVNGRISDENDETEELAEKDTTDTARQKTQQTVVGTRKKKKKKKKKKAKEKVEENREIEKNTTVSLNSEFLR